MIINYDRTFIMIVDYDHKTFIVQATGPVFATPHFLNNLQKAQPVRVLLYDRLEKLEKNKQSSLQGLFVSYKENKVL